MRQGPWGGAGLLRRGTGGSVSLSDRLGPRPLAQWNPGWGAGLLLIAKVGRAGFESSLAYNCAPFPARGPTLPCLVGFIFTRQTSLQVALKGNLLRPAACWWASSQLSRESRWVCSGGELGRDPPAAAGFVGGRRKPWRTFPFPAKWQGPGMLQKRAGSPGASLRDGERGLMGREEGCEREKSRRGLHDLNWHQLQSVWRRRGC